jgi:RNA polymerase sigma-70 factor (ECF subfamily)
VDCSDEAIFSRAQQGDHTAFGLLVQRYQDRVYSLALRFLHCPHDAQDTAQQAFLQLWHKRHAYNARWRFKTWLYRLVTNLCIDQYRRHQRRPQAPATTLATLPSSHSPAHDYEQREQRASLSAALAHLAPEARIVLTLCYLEELSYKEIAQIRGMSVNTVKSHLRRAKAQLRHHLAPYYEETV